MTHSNPTVLITGAASGLGRALALAYAKQGYSICVADMNQQRGEETVALVKGLQQEAFFQPLDVRLMDDFSAATEAILQRWNRLDVLINNAGVASAGSFEEVSLETWDWMLSINLMGVVRGCRAVVPLFKQQHAGHIVNIASMAGLVPPPGMCEYNVAKAGVIALSETLFSELQPYGIDVTVVCPSFFKTNLGESFRATSAHVSTSFQQLLEKSDLSADDIAAMTFQAMSQKQLFLLPHQSAQAAYKVKQQHPEQYYQEMHKVAERNKRKNETQGSNS